MERPGILSDGSVVTWGDPEAGGDSSLVKHQLKSVVQVQATGRAFAAVLALAVSSLACWHSALACQHSRASTRELSTHSNEFFRVCILVNILI